MAKLCRQIIHTGFKVADSDIESKQTIENLVKQIPHFDGVICVKNYVYHAQMYNEEGMAAWFNKVLPTNGRIVAIFYKKIEGKPYRFNRETITPLDWIVVALIEYHHGNTREQSLFRIFDSNTKNYTPKEIFAMVHSGEMTRILVNDFITLVPYKYVQPYTKEHVDHWPRIIITKQGDGSFIEKLN